MRNFDFNIETNEQNFKTEYLWFHITKNLNNNFGLIFPIKSNINNTTKQTHNKISKQCDILIRELAYKLGLVFIEEKTPLNLPNGETYSHPYKDCNSSPLGRSGGVGYITANPQSYKFVKEMRDVMKQNPTEAEKIMWEYLRNKKTGHKIRRQHIIDDYITDFVCLSKNIVIEIDGKIHLKQKEYDEIRTQRLNELGYEVIRFTNEEVFSDPELVTSKIKQKLDSKTYLTLNLDQSNSLLPSKDVYMPIDLLDFIYASFFYYDYNEKLNDFLIHDLLKVQIPKNKTTFWQLVKFGREIRQIHMFESPIIDQFVTVYPAKGDNLVSDISYRGGHTGIVEVGEVYINNSQYFANVPELVWRFSIANFYPAQKWLKDRKGSKLDLFEIMHYQKLIISLSETIRLIFEINKLEIE